jgi:hypothetical protein
MPLDLSKWNALPEETKVQLRKLYTTVYRKALEQIKQMRDSLAELQDVDNHAKAQVNAILGESEVQAMFGCDHPFSVDDATLLTDKFTILSFEHMDDMLEQKQQQFEHIELPGTHCLPEEI